MGGGPQPNDVRQERDQPIVAVDRLVVESNSNGHGENRLPFLWNSHPRLFMFKACQPDGWLTSGQEAVWRARPAARLRPPWDDRSCPGGFAVTGLVRWSK